jgi:hypothetical protein
MGKTGREFRRSGIIRLPVRDAQSCRGYRMLSMHVENPSHNPAVNLGATNPNFIRAPAKRTTGLGYEVGLKTDFLAGRISSSQRDAPSGNGSEGFR